MLWSRILKVVGGIAMLLGTLDPPEGWLLILPGSGLVALGMSLGRKDRKTVLCWTWASFRCRSSTETSANVTRRNSKLAVPTSRREHRFHAGAAALSKA